HRSPFIRVFKSMQSPRDSTPIYSSMESDPDLLDLIVMYVEDARDFMEQLTTAFNQKAWNDLASIAHQVKGSAGSHGFQQVTEAAKQLERSCIEIRLPDQIEQELHVLLNLLGRLQVSTA
ncbi:MAG: Hpt domain-containing protein, partial [Planctomycetota bacterium]|nr:Hpt domain-containing protein [Planctomycetota bacterium]